MSQGEVLKYLEKNETATSSEIAEAFNISKSAAMKNLKTLERHGEIVGVEPLQFGNGKVARVWRIRR